MRNSFSCLCLWLSLVLAVAHLAAQNAPTSGANVPESAPQIWMGAIATTLQPFVDDHTIAGAVTLVATKDKVLDLEAVGYADLAAKKPMAADDMFWIASMTKSLTATALMMLVDEGKVNVNDPVEKYVPAFKGQMFIAEKDDDHVLLKKPQHPILVREILTHTSGLPYEQFMEERFFKPLGMKDTTFWPNEDQLRRLAKSYCAGKNGLQQAKLPLSDPLSDRTRQPVPAAGLFSTASDLARFCQMILRGGVYQGKRYLSEAAIRQMTTKQTGMPEEYGFGWSTLTPKISPWGNGFGHEGAYKTSMAIDPKLGRIVIFLVQQASDWTPEGNKMRALVAAEANKLVLGKANGPGEQAGPGAKSESGPSASRSSKPLPPTSTQSKRKDISPSVWFASDGDTPDLMDLFTRPESWPKARSHINVVKFGMFSADRLADFRKVDAFDKLQQWGISIALEAPAVKEWDCTGQAAAQQTINHIHSVHDANGLVQFIAMDEPMVSGHGRNCQQAMEETAAKTASYAQSILANKDVPAWAPSLQVGDIEPYPSFKVAQLKRWIKELEKNGFKPGFFHLDVDVYSVDVHPAVNLTADLRELKTFFAAEEIPFGVIFWSGHDPENSDQSYYNHVIDWVKRVHSAIGKPDQAIFQSWVLRVSQSCLGSVRCGAKNTRCSAADPSYCGQHSVPINLPEDDPRIFSHTRLLNDSLAILNDGPGTAVNSGNTKSILGAGTPEIWLAASPLGQSQMYEPDAPWERGGTLFRTLFRRLCFIRNEAR